MCEIPDKPFRSFSELVSVLQCKHKLFVPNPSEAEKVLTIVPYYDLVNGYKDLFMNGTDEFSPFVTFDDLYLFHIFNHGFQVTLFPFSTIIENYFKNVLAYVIAKDFGVFESHYLAKSHYIGNIGNRSFSDVQNGITATYKGNHIDEPTLYYSNRHNHIPPWILLKNVTFSRSVNLFEFLKSEQRSQVCDILLPFDIPQNQKYQLLLYSLTLIRKCRNTIAHNLKFTSFSIAEYNKHLPHTALRTLIPPELMSWKDIRTGKNLAGVFAYIVFSLSLIPDSTIKLFFLQNLISYLSTQTFEYKDSVVPDLASVYIQKMKFPPDIIDRLNRYKNRVACSQGENI